MARLHDIHTVNSASPTIRKIAPFSELKIWGLRDLPFKENWQDKTSYFLLLAVNSSTLEQIRVSHVSRPSAAWYERGWR